MTEVTAPEQRTIDVDVQSLDTRGRTLHGYAAVYGAESGDLGGFRERIAPGAFASVLDADVRCLLNHEPSQVLGRTRSGTLRLRDEQRGLRFECDLPDSPLGENVREAVKRGDVDGASFRFQVGEESWDGEVRTVNTIAELHDVTVATYGAYPAASVELRSRPEPEPDTSDESDRPMTDTDEPTGGLAVEDRAATSSGPSIEQRVLDSIRSIHKGESRSLSTVSASPVAPEEQGSFLWDRLRAASIGLASGLRVIPTTRESITWPQLVSDVDPSWVAELATIPEGPPGLASLEAKPKKLAHRIADISNEVIDDSEPSIVDVLNGHLAIMLGLKLDRSIFEGDPSVDADSIRGLRHVAGIQSIVLGTNGGALTNYDPFVQAVGLLRSANVPGPYAVAVNPRTQTTLDLLKESADSNTALEPPSTVPPFFTSSQLSVTETQGTATNASSAYVYAPDQVVLVRRKDAEIELDRSVGFDNDSSSMRGKLRADLLVPNPVSVVRIAGITP